MRWKESAGAAGTRFRSRGLARSLRRLRRLHLTVHHRAEVSGHLVKLSTSSGKGRSKAASEVASARRSAIACSASGVNRTAPPVETTYCHANVWKRVHLASPRRFRRSAPRLAGPRGRASTTSGGTTRFPRSPTYPRPRWGPGFGAPGLGFGGIPRRPALTVATQIQALCRATSASFRAMPTRHRRRGTYRRSA